MKTCRDCKIEKPLDDFYTDRRYAGERRPECKPCFQLMGKKNRRKCLDLPEKKTCRGCGEEKPSIRFGLDKRNADGLRHYCLGCREKRTPEQLRARQLKFHYGITPEQYAEMNEKQGGLCASCGEPPRPDARKKGLFVDHCHDSGKVRALLCSRCNSALGLLDEDPEKILALAAYIVQHQAQTASC